ncbi:MAG: UvrD-helicase domain-containing protein, partial [Planctomycetes bacterium]|nr:UvrD-helicase domain-containing protein [Planctomycetota bacterium]
MSSSAKLTAAQQAAAIDRAGESLALLSGAGCGKTLVLSRRYTELLLSSDADEPMSRLVALTFTDKAAGEMIQRVRSELSAKAAQSKGRLRRKLLGWLEQLSDAHISTIHSFCASVLRSFAIEANVDPDFAVCADNLLIEQMIADAVDDTLLKTIEAGHEGVAELLSRYSYDQLQQWVCDLVGDRTARTALDGRDPAKTLDHWRKMAVDCRRAAWKRLDTDTKIPAMIDRLAAFECANPTDKLLGPRDELLDAAREILASAAARTPEMFAATVVKPGNAGSDKNWGGADSAKEVRHAIKALVEAIGDYAIYAGEIDERDEQAAKVLAVLAEMSDKACESFESAKRRAGLVDFTDLIERTANLLASNPRVRSMLQGQIDQLLIDECQDTDQFQIDLLGMLVSLPGADEKRARSKFFGMGDDEKSAPHKVFGVGDDEKSAPHKVFGVGDGEKRAKGKFPVVGDGQKSATAKLFVVGDAKQSIYRFRGAQVEVFRDLCKRLGKGNCENLDVSFRAHAAGVEFVNKLFAPLMGDDYSPIRAHRKTCPDAPSVEILLARGADDKPVVSAEDAVTAQAAITAQRISEMIAGKEKLVWDASGASWRPARPGDIAILLSRTARSIEFERQMHLRDIPCYVVAGTGFFRRQEVWDVLNALAVVDNPFDDVAFFGVLRSGLIGLDDNALMRIAEAFDPPYLPQLPDSADALPAGFSDSQRRDLALATSLLHRLNRNKDAAGVDSIIEQLLDASGYEATLLGQFQGRRMLGNVRMLLDRARAAAGQGASLSLFLEQMDRLVMAEARHEQAAVVGEEEDVVRVMTIHKAKGLEFPIVFLPDINAAIPPETPHLLMRRDWGLTWMDRGESGLEEDAPLSARIARRM